MKISPKNEKSIIYSPSCLSCTTIFFLQNTKYILKNVGKQTVSGPLDFHYNLYPYNGI